MTHPFHETYRPTSYAEVLGQASTKRALHDAVERGRSRAFLLSGPPGLGKTTLARIAAAQMGAGPADILELDGATSTGIDAMREVQVLLEYKPFSRGNRAVILDEAQALSKQAWSSLLKVIEEPPDHVAWFLCTTEPTKVPVAIKSRCLPLALSPVKPIELKALLLKVKTKEGLVTPDDILDLCVGEAGGSPRQALVNLATVADITDAREARELLREPVESDAALAFCQFLVKGGTWAKAVTLLKAIEDEGAEDIRLRVCQYLAKTLAGTTDEEKAVRLLQTLDAFATPYHPGEKLAPLYLSMGKVLFPPG